MVRRRFRKVAKDKETGSGQTALRKMIRNDGSEVSLKSIQELYT